MLRFVSGRRAASALLRCRALQRLPAVVRSGVPVTTFSRIRTFSETASHVPHHGRDAKSVMVKLAKMFGSKKEVEYYLKHFSSVDSKKFAVIKVGGGVLDNEMDTFTESLAFLHQVGLTPVVIHGGGPQLNATLAEAKIESEYVNGLRVTTPEIMKIARQIFLRENRKLVRALEAKGVGARPVVAGVFEAEPLDSEKLKLVGNVTNVHTEAIFDAIETGHMPILTCMGETPAGQALNINADIAARSLAKAIQPLKIIYISSSGGLRDQNDELIREIDLTTQFNYYMSQPWFKHGNRLKLREIKDVMDVLGSQSSVAITSAKGLTEELFTHKGQGTLIRKQERIHSYMSLDGIDTEALIALIENGFNGKLDKGYIDYIRPIVHRIYIDEAYQACAIVTLRPGGVPYLDKFVVSTQKQSQGTGQRIWDMLWRDTHKLFWRSRAVNPLNAWYFPRCQGSFVDQTDSKWVVFYYGVNNIAEAAPLVKEALAQPVFLKRNSDLGPELPYDPTAPVPSNDFSRSPARSYHTTSVAARVMQSRMGMQHRPTGLVRAGTAQSTHRFARHFASSAAAQKVGLIGARGHTGAELIKLIDGHNGLTLSLASSRSLKGQPLQALSDTLSLSSKLAPTRFVDLSPEDIAKKNHADVDVWILAMPNDASRPFVDAIQKAGSSAKIVDLSADYRFTKEWAYGLPERHGAREGIRNAARVANPGCYATGMQVSLFPIVPFLDCNTYTPTVFGVSGYSGAGTTPSRKNDPKELHDNLMPYSLVNHTHEAEVSSQLRHQMPSGIRFMPHVAPWFRGISLTIALQLQKKMARADIISIYREYYKSEPLISVTDGIPEVRAAVGKHGVTIGGFVCNESANRLVLTTTLDNLLKGAATQCIQNVNLMSGLPELAGIPAAPQSQPQ